MGCHAASFRVDHSSSRSAATSTALLAQAMLAMSLGRPSASVERHMPGYLLSGLAKLRRRLGQRLEHHLQIICRAADDLEHVGGGGLLLQRFAQIVGSLAQLLEQADVLNSDDGLAGEVSFSLTIGTTSSVRELIGAFGIYRQEVRPFTAKQIELVHEGPTPWILCCCVTRGPGCRSAMSLLRHSAESRTSAAPAACLGWPRHGRDSHIHQRVSNGLHSASTFSLHCAD
jgi:hypothetical protein